MIHQLFTIIQEKVFNEERASFADVRLRIAHCSRVAEAKSLITAFLANTNRKYILE